MQEFPNDSNFDGVRFEFYLSVDDCIEQKYVCTEFALFVADLFDGVELELFWSGIRSDLAFFPFLLATIHIFSNNEYWVDRTLF